jgi:8-oxo-dGTP diphosphatase
VSASFGPLLRDGDGWTRCSLGHRHWGLHGAAGLLLAAPGPAVLLQHRAAWSHHGDTWGLPGGALGRSEDAVAAALREATEETGLDTSSLVVVGELVDDHGGWSYTTVLATADAELAVHALDRESTDVRWVHVDGVVTLPLHPGFAGTWPELRSRL